MKIRRAEFEIPSSLLYAVLVAVLIIAFYITTVEYAKKESEKVYGPGGGNVGAGFAYEALKKACLNWVSYINLCTDCDCSNCKDSFLQELSIFSAYHIPYYVSASKLASYDRSSKTFGPNPDLAYQEGSCPAPGCTITCAGALTAMDVSPETGDFMGETKKALYPVTDDTVAKNKAKTRRDKLMNEYARPCAQLCLWVAGRSQECALGSETCAKGLPPEYQKLP